MMTKHTKQTKKPKLPRRKHNDPTIRVNDWVRLRMPTLIEVGEYTKQCYYASDKPWSALQEQIVNKNQPVRVITMNDPYINIIQIVYKNEFAMNLNVYFPLCCATRVIKNSTTNKMNDSVNIITDTDRAIKLE